MLPIKVLLVEDHEVVREGLKTVLQKYPQISVVGEAGTAAGAIDQATTLQPDVVLLDLRLPDESGLHVCRQIRKQQTKIRILILTSVADEASVLESIAAGADGYVLKAIDSDGLVDSIQKIMSGQSVLDPAVTRVVFNKVQNPKHPPNSPANKLESLSKQEFRIMAFVAEGKTNKQIAELLQLSDKTVKNYLSNAMDKLEMSRRTQAAVYFAQNAKLQSSN